MLKRIQIDLNEKFDAGLRDGESRFKVWGIFHQGSLIYLIDKLDIYLIEAATGTIRQRKRYSSFENLLPQPGPDLYRNREEAQKLYHGIFCKTDILSGKIEFFKKTEKNKFKRVKEINLLSLINSRSKHDISLFIQFEGMQISGTSDNQLSIFTYFTLASAFSGQRRKILIF